MKEQVQEILTAQGFDDLFEVKRGEVFFQTYRAARAVAVKLNRSFTETEDVINGNKFTFVVMTAKESDKFL